MLIGILAAEALLAFCTLAFELAMARLVAPHAGMSTDTWTAIIAAFLIAWALGTFVGGRLAERASIAQVLLRAAIAAAAGAVLAVIVPATLNVWDSLVLDPAPLQVWRVVVFAGLPPLPVGFCFGLAAPLLLTAIVRLTNGSGQNSGLAIGLVNAMGAAGSVLGALAMLWFLLDTWGARGAVLCIAALAFVTALLLLALAWRLRDREVPA
ncbi:MULTISPECIES: fused MFS/spermidine synthase [unclassified Beijerinckia]|uniref:fused MFS/spermidine synthase n=1 Tax=unclassified Beijerinckia TaxID=2638183 RepID=UPI00089B2C5D|nr:MULTISPECIES: fused MFS/spermidine synthase [unclassified Beijerinckia]MDH7798370.1 MFS family permease [Beijerinckia sp. GAS462]SED18660.1 hypothetical protein SAMN05443249_4668 [Beijerinckia sp. 28-YEA-48]